MPEVEEAQQQQEVSVTMPISEPLIPAHTENEPLSEDEANEIFLNAVAEIPTQPLPRFTPGQKQSAERNFLFFTVLAILAFLSGSIVAFATYPTVTITLVPVQKSETITTILAISTRSFPPVTLSKSLTTTTTGHGHQTATQATGTLTLYNGLFTQETIPRGTVFTGSDGIHIVTDDLVTISAANPPQFAEATVSAHAITKGAAGNIHAGDINTTVANGVLVKNVSAFAGGRDARDYQAVAQHDLDSLTVKLQQQLNEELPHLFLVRSGEALHTTTCILKTASNHQVGDEAQTVTVTVSQTCKAIAYNPTDLARKAITAFTFTRPGSTYELVGTVATSILTFSPFTVQIKGLWVYVLSQDIELLLAQKLAGDTPSQAKRYLLHTGFITEASIPRQLPKDPGHIQFQILIGL